MIHKRVEHEEVRVKRLQMIRKKILPFMISLAVAGSQISVMAADFDDAQAVSYTHLTLPTN